MKSVSPKRKTCAKERRGSATQIKNKSKKQTNIYLSFVRLIVEKREKRLVVGEGAHRGVSTT